MNQFVFEDKDNIASFPEEVARYLGYPKNALVEKEIAEVIGESIREMSLVLRPALAYEKFPLTVDEKSNLIEFAGFSITSAALARNLKGCREVILFAATIGSSVDALIRKYQKIDTVKAAVMQATGAMFIESFVDSFNDSIKKQCQIENKTVRPRFSPGFGDVPLAVQKDFFRFLNCQKIGLTLMETLIMAPEKSVTAFIGIC